MHRVVIEEPYEFVPPYKGRLWSTVFQRLLPWHLKSANGITEFECRGVEHLTASLRARHGILLCPNHCRPSDPMSMGLINRAARCHSWSMASWHVFKQTWFQGFITRRLGAFSIYREGLDRQALNTAIELVTEARRPLVVFPEGVISRCNDHLLALMDGTAFIARSAAKKRAKLNPENKVVIHPVALRYEFKGDLNETIAPVLAQIEQRLTWQDRSSADIFTRIRRIGTALLTLKEIEYTGSAGQGDPYDRLEALINFILEPLEQEWLNGPRDGTVITRVKDLRTAILPDMVNKEVDEAERSRRWKQLADVYLAQQLSLYPRGYVDENSPPERILETVERFEEDLTDQTRVHTPMKLILQVGEPIVVETSRPRGEADPLMTGLRDKLTTMIGALAEEVAVGRN